jgi:hypothetical protein
VKWLVAFAVITGSIEPIFATPRSASLASAEHVIATSS